MLKQHPNLSSQLEFTFEDVTLDKAGEMMKANRINPETNPIMHEFLATEENQKLLLDLF